MKKMIAFVFFFMFSIFAQEFPLDNQQSVMPTDQSAVPETMTLPECKEKLANCSKEVSDMQAELDEANKRITKITEECKKCKVDEKKQQKVAADIAVSAAHKVSKKAEELPEKQKKDVQEKALAVIQSNTADETLRRFKELSDKIYEVRGEILNRIKDLEARQAAQDAKIADHGERLDNHGERLDNIEEGVFNGYFGVGFMTSSIFTAGYGTVGTMIKIGNLKGKFKADLGVSLYGTEIKNLLGFEGRGLIRWASEDFIKFINIALGGAGGAMTDVNNAGSIANAYGGGIVELEAVFKEHYGIATSILLGASDSQNINGSHDTNFLWCFNVGIRYHF